jgi:DNA-binding NarL/FixJ family response regulator
LLAVEFEATTEQAATAAAGLAKFQACKPIITVLDLNLPDQGGLTLLRRLKCEDPAARIVVLSMHNDALSAAASLRAGAIAYLSKSAGPDLIIEAIRSALEDRPYIEPRIAQELAIQQTIKAGDPLGALTPQEFELLRLIMAGRHFDQIAQSLGVADKTVANRKTALRAKLNAATDVDLIRMGLAAGLTLDYAGES